MLEGTYPRLGEEDSWSGDGVATARRHEEDSGEGHWSERVRGSQAEMQRGPEIKVSSSRSDNHANWRRHDRVQPSLSYISFRLVRARTEMVLDADIPDSYSEGFHSRVFVEFQTIGANEEADMVQNQSLRQQQSEHTARVQPLTYLKFLKLPGTAGDLLLIDTSTWLSTCLTLLKVSPTSDSNLFASLVSPGKLASLLLRTSSCFLFLVTAVSTDVSLVATGAFAGCAGLTPPGKTKRGVALKYSACVPLNLDE
nr:hypothetical protein Iba_chr12eCG5260 [Ipomoea batatas]